MNRREFIVLLASGPVLVTLPEVVEAPTEYTVPLDNTILVPTWADGGHDILADIRALRREIEGRTGYCCEPSCHSPPRS